VGEEGWGGHGPKTGRSAIEEEEEKEKVKEGCINFKIRGSIIYTADSILLILA
jgi:hypothetical protein